MTPKSHPLPETLISFASGALPNATLALVACHLSICRVCARDTRRLEQLGGLLLSRLDVTPAESSIGRRAFAGLLTRVPANETQRDPVPQWDDQLLPPLLMHNFPISDEISWEMVSPGAQQYRIALPKEAGRIRLLRLTPGAIVPQCAHPADAGLALVLQGVLSHKCGDFVRGDVIEWSGESDRETKASGDIDCICLIASASARVDTSFKFREQREKAASLALRLGGAVRNSISVAAGFALLIGFGFGLLLQRVSETSTIADFIRVDGKRLIARGALREALEVLPSGRETVASLDGHEIRLDIKMTFEEQSGHYCRQYRVVASPSGHYSGIACRIGGDWTVRMQALLPPPASASNHTVPADAGPNAAMDAVIGAWISGDPLVGDNEAAAISKGWQK